MKSKSFMLMILSMGFGLVAAIGISQVMGRSNGPTVAATQTAPVLVAAADLEHNSFLTEENVRVENWPVEIIPENAATKIEQITDMASKAALSKGMPIMVPHLIHKKAVGDINIPHGSTVMAIKVAEDDTFAGLLKPGDKVNVIGFFNTRDRSGTVSKTFLKGLRVWSVNSQMTAQAGSREETSTRGSAIIGVLVTERQAEAIVYVQKTGSLKLVLRGDQVEDGDDDNLDMAVFGMTEGMEPEKVATNGDPNSTKPRTSFNLFGGPRAVETSMIVWYGNEPQKTTFKDGGLPDSSYRRPGPNSSGPAIPAAPANPAAPENPAPQVTPAPQTAPDSQSNPATFDDKDRGLEEDQYRGE